MRNLLKKFKKKIKRKKKMRINLPHIQYFYSIILLKLNKIQEENNQYGTQLKEIEKINKSEVNTFKDQDLRFSLIREQNIN